MHYQGELEHRTSKARFARTNSKAFIKQIANIERRQTHIRRLKKKHHAQIRQFERSAYIKKNGAILSSEPKSFSVAVDDNSEAIAHSPEYHYSVGKSEYLPENIPLFLQAHTCDPAVRVTWSPTPTL